MAVPNASYRWDGTDRISSAAISASSLIATACFPSLCSSAANFLITVTLNQSKYVNELLEWESAGMHLSMSFTTSDPSNKTKQGTTVTFIFAF